MLCNGCACGMGVMNLHAWGFFASVSRLRFTGAEGDGQVGVGLGSLRWMFSPGDKSEALEKGKNMD